ncbi:MAG: YcxB family protein [Oscillochloris sp.]|nr:YcxB family protein [Oscillochloris sp.]
MVVEARLSPTQFRRIALLRHFQRPGFYFYSLTAAALTAGVLALGMRPIFLAVGWIPFVIYMVLGFINAIVGSRGDNRPYLLQTRYEFNARGVKMSTSQGSSELDWDAFLRWRKVINCYVLELKSGLVIAFPNDGLSPQRIQSLDDLFSREITKRNKGA